MPRLCGHYGIASTRGIQLVSPIVYRYEKVHDASQSQRTPSVPGDWPQLIGLKYHVGWLA